MTMRNLSLSMIGCPLFAALPCFSQAADAPRKTTTPKEAFGVNVGDDYHMANYAQLTSYWQKLGTTTARLKLVAVGPTAEGRTQHRHIISSQKNIRHIDHY